MEYCFRCGKELTYNDIGAYKKFINRGSVKFMCKACLAAYFGTTTENLDELAEYYRREGCSLFD